MHSGSVSGLHQLIEVVAPKRLTFLHLSLVVRLALLPRIGLLGGRQPYHQITQTRLGCGQHVKCRTNSSLHKMPRKRNTAKSRNLRTNSDTPGNENLFNIRMLITGGGCSRMRTCLSLHCREISPKCWEKRPYCSLITFCLQRFTTNYPLPGCREKYEGLQGRVG